MFKRYMGIDIHRVGALSHRSWSKATDPGYMDRKWETSQQNQRQVSQADSKSGTQAVAGKPEFAATQDANLLLSSPPTGRARTGCV